MEDVAKVASGERTTFAIKKDGCLWAWGDNVSGLSFMNGTEEGCEVPVKIAEEVIAVSANGDAVMIKNDNSVWTWGFMIFSHMMEYEPPIKIMDGVKKVSAGVEHNVALDLNGAVWTFGGNYYGQLGDGKTEGSGYLYSVVTSYTTSVRTSYTVFK